MHSKGYWIWGNKGTARMNTTMIIWKWFGRKEDSVSIKSSRNSINSSKFIDDALKTQQ